MQHVTRPQHYEGRVVTVGPGLLDVELSAVGGLVAELAFATEHRLSLEVHGAGSPAGTRGRITSDFVVTADGSVAEHRVVVLIDPTTGGGTR